MKVVLTPQGSKIASRIAGRRLAKAPQREPDYAEMLRDMHSYLQRAAAAKTRIEKAVQNMPDTLRDLKDLYANMVAMVEVNGWTVMGTTVK